MSKNPEDKSGEIVLSPKQFGSLLRLLDEAYEGTDSIMAKLFPDGSFGLYTSDADELVEVPKLRLKIWEDD